MFTAQDFLAMMADEGDKREVVRVMLNDVSNKGAAYRIIKAYADCIDYAVLGKEACSKPHNRCQQVTNWLRRPYISEKLEALIKDEALAEQLEGII